MEQHTYLKQLHMLPFPHHLLFKKVVLWYVFILISDSYLLFLLLLFSVLFLRIESFAIKQEVVFHELEHLDFHLMSILFDEEYT